MGNTKLRFFTIADYEEEERWLREQHKQGLRLVKMIPPCFFVFEPCTPEDVVYRLDYQNGSETCDYMQLFHDYGWAYVTRCTGWLYFRKPACEMQSEHDDEIFSDAESKIDMIQHVMNTRMLPILVIFLCCVLPNWVNALNGTFGTANVFFGIFFTGAMLLYIFLLFHCGRKLLKLRRKYNCK